MLIQGRHKLMLYNNHQKIKQRLRGKNLTEETKWNFKKYTGLLQEKSEKKDKNNKE